MKRMILGLILWNFASAAEVSFYDDHERGWHWYETLQQEEEERLFKEKDAKTEQYPATKELKKYQAELEEAKAKAVLHPTERNVLEYQQKQYEMIEKSGKFADVWMKNVYLNPNVDATLNSPIFAPAKRIHLGEQHQRRAQKIRQLSQEYGLFFFFKKQCPYCEEFAPIVKSFSEKYNWEVLAISEFGEKLPMFERNLQDNGLAETWGVNSYPSLFAVNPKTGHVIPIANGMISIQEMEERIIAIAGGDDA